MGRQSFSNTQDQVGANRFGLWLFIGTLAIFFAGALLAMLAIRLETPQWPADLPPLPGLLWWSTGVLIASTVTIHLAVRSRRREQHDAVRRLLVVSLILSIVFLVLQTLAWLDWMSAFKEVSGTIELHRMAQTGFFVLTGLHAAHIIPGLIPLAVAVWYAVARGMVTSSLHGVSIYWHFLDAVWIVLVLFMLLVL